MSNDNSKEQGTLILFITAIVPEESVYKAINHGWRDEKIVCYTIQCTQDEATQIATKWRERNNLKRPSASWHGKIDV